MRPWKIISLGTRSGNRGATKLTLRRDGHCNVSTNELVPFPSLFSGNKSQYLFDLISIFGSFFPYFSPRCFSNDHPLRSERLERSELCLKLSKKNQKPLLSLTNDNAKSILGALVYLPPSNSIQNLFKVRPRLRDRRRARRADAGEVLVYQGDQARDELVRDGRRPDLKVVHIVVEDLHEELHV